MAEDNFRNQPYSDYEAFDTYLNKTMTLNLATNTMADEIFDVFCNPLYPDSVPRDSYFDEPIALNAVVDGIASTNFDVIPNQVCPYNSYFDNPMTLNTEVGSGFSPENIACDSDGDKPLTFNTVADGIASINFDVIPNQIYPYNSYFDNPMTLNTEVGSGFSPENIACDSDGDEPLILNLATSTAVDDAFDVQTRILPDFDEPTTEEFQTWKKRWDEKMLLVQWKREGKDWDDITKALRKMKTRKRNTRKSMLQRADSEIEALGRAAAADREGEADRLRDMSFSYVLGDAVRVDYDGLWARISESMVNFGGKRKWSSHRVKYAWNNGVSGFYPHITLRQRVLFQAILI